MLHVLLQVAQHVRQLVVQGGHAQGRGWVALQTAVRLFQPEFLLLLQKGVLRTALLFALLHQRLTAQQVTNDKGESLTGPLGLFVVFGRLALLDLELGVFVEAFVGTLVEVLVGQSFEVSHTSLLLYLVANVGVEEDLDVEVVLVGLFT